jgi:FkbM family methyltransferase
MGSKVKFLPRPLRRWVRRLHDLPTRLREWRTQRHRLGKSAAWKLVWSAFRHPIGDPTDPPGPLDSVTLPGIPHPFWFRHGTSDVQAIRQIFVRREYEWLSTLPNVQTIVDAGANVGAASVFLLDLFPQARLVAIEPAAGNLAVLEKNLAHYGNRATVVRGAVWPSATKLEIDRGYRDGLDWSIRVRPGEGEVEGITVPQLMERQRLDPIDLLKIDIEGAERELFAGDTSWLPCVRHLCIELHDEDCRRAFDTAMSGFTCERQTHGETTLCANLRAISPP